MPAEPISTAAGAAAGTLAAHSYYEAKYKDPLGIVFDLTHTGWIGAVKDVVAKRELPATAHSQTSPIASSSSAPARSGSACRWHWPRKAYPVCLIEALGDDNFLEQVPRAGTNHPATLEMFDRIGLYDKLEPRGIIAPLFHYWDRHENRLIAEFDHAHLKDDTRFPYVLQCERIKIVEEALAAREGASR